MIRIGHQRMIQEEISVEEVEPNVIRNNSNNEKGGKTIKVGGKSSINPTTQNNGNQKNRSITSQENSKRNFQSEISKITDKRKDKLNSTKMMVQRDPYLSSKKLSNSDKRPKLQRKIVYKEAKRKDKKAKGRKKPYKISQ